MEIPKRYTEIKNKNVNSINNDNDKLEQERTDVGINIENYVKLQKNRKKQKFIQSTCIHAHVLSSQHFSCSNYVNNNSFSNKYTKSAICATCCQP